MVMDRWFFDWESLRWIWSILNGKNDPRFDFRRFYESVRYTWKCSNCSPSDPIFIMRHFLYSPVHQCPCKKWPNWELHPPCFLSPNTLVSRVMYPTVSPSMSRWYVHSPTVTSQHGVTWRWHFRPPRRFFYVPKKNNLRNNSIWSQQMRMTSILRVYVKIMRLVWITIPFTFPSHLNPSSQGRKTIPSPLVNPPIRQYGLSMVTPHPSRNN